MIKLISAKKNKIAHVFFLLVARATASIGGVAIIYFVAQAYGEAGVAEVSMLIAASIGISIFSRYGMDLAGIKIFPPYIHKKEYGQLKAAIFYFVSRTAILQAAMLTIFMFVYNGNVRIDPWALIVCSISCSVLALCSVIGKSLLMPARSAFYEVGYFLLLASIILAISYSALSDTVGVQQLVAMSAAIYVSMAGIYMLYLVRHVLQAEREHLNISTRDLNRQCFDFTLINASGYLYSYGYIWLSGIVLTLSEVAAAGVLSRVVFAINFSVMIANSIYNPKYSISIASNDHAGVELYAAKSLKLMLIISVPPFLLITLFPREVYELFSIEPDSHIVAALLAMAVAQLINVATGNAAAILNLSGLHKIVRNNSIIHAVLGVVLAYVMGVLHGLTGLVFSISFVLASQNLILVYVLYQKTGINIYKRMFT